jgi:hypothetical protein
MTFLPPKTSFRHFPIGCWKWMAGVLFLVSWTGVSASASQISSLSTATNGRKILRAARTSAPIRLDGELSENAWRESEAAQSFVQAEPYEGSPATERTEVRVLYNDDSLYIGVYCYDAEPARILINSLKEDFDPRDNDSFELILDTFRDGRNGYLFITNPDGAKRDAQVTDEGREINSDWDTVWDVRTQRNGDGWTAEIVIPFKSLSFAERRADSAWGINFGRRIRRKNEMDYWAPVPRRYEITRLSLAGELHGLEEIERGRNVRVKPFVAANLNRFAARDRVGLKAKEGLDVKYSITPSLTLDLTGNTDFSDVEVDEQQINLTRFPLFFPEKREFFLENSGIFQFGDIPGERGSRSYETQLFFSRRIGLSDEGEPIPIWGGARLSGQVGRFRVGLLNMQTKETNTEPGNNFTVTRVKRDVFANSDIGAIFINRQASEGNDYNRAAGVDGNFRFGQNFTLNGYLAKTFTDGLRGRDLARKLTSQWRDNLITVQAIFTDQQENFHPEVGFTERTGIRSLRSRIELKPRPPRNRLIREFRPHAYPHYQMDQDNRLLTRTFHYGFDVLFHNGSVIEVKHETTFDRLDEPFRIRRVPPLVTIPAGDYNFNLWGLELQSDPSRRFSGTLDYRNGDFYTGTRTTLVATGIMRANERFAVEGRYTHNDVELREGSFTTTLISSRISYFFSTRMFLSTLLQYNSDRKQVTSNIRFNFIHRPLSDLFLVYNEQRDTSGAGIHDRALTLKYTHLFSF